jgi:Na+/H+ antiporter
VIDQIQFIVGMLFAVAVLTLLARKIGIAYPILFVVAGSLLGLVPGLPKMEMNPVLVFVFFLPPLLFPVALFTSWRDFRANLRPILLLAVGLVLFTTVAVALLAHHFIADLPLAAAFVLGAIISPPDAVAATAIVERLNVPRRIVSILEGESLVNDVTALVAYRFAVSAVVTGAFSATEAATHSVLVAAGGIALGLAIGWLAAWFHRQIDDPPIEITISLLTPFAAYLAAERCGVSGILAVVTAGFFLGWRSPQIISSRTRLQAGPVWDMIEFLLNGFVFILIGLQLPHILSQLSKRSIPQLTWYAALISVIVIVVRILWVFPATYLPRLMSRRLRQRDPFPRWQSVALISWTGMRGVVSLAAALALPLTTENGQAFPGRDLILFLTFVVILATLVFQGLTLPFLIRVLGIEDDNSAAREEREARLKANRAALDRLGESPDDNPAAREARERLRIEYDDRIRQLEASAENAGGPPSLFSSAYENLSHDMLQLEREIILQLRNQSVISDEVLRRIQRDIDLAEVRLRRHH